MQNVFCWFGPHVSGLLQACCILLLIIIFFPEKKQRDVKWKDLDEKPLCHLIHSVFCVFSAEWVLKWLREWRQFPPDASEGPPGPQCFLHALLFLSPGHRSFLPVSRGEKISITTSYANVQEVVTVINTNKMKTNYTLFKQRFPKEPFSEQFLK